MVPFSSWNFLSGILCTQHGDARSNSMEGFRHCVSADRVAGLGDPGAAHSETKDEEVAEASFFVGDATEAWFMTEGSAEGGPPLEDGETGCCSLGDNRGVCGLKRKAEISSVEAISGLKVCCCQGVASGYCWARWEAKEACERVCRREASSATTFSGPGR